MKLRIFEVGPRDGLQNEAIPVSLEDKFRFVAGLVRAGLNDLEVGAFVRPDRVPQMADTSDLIKKIGDHGFSSQRFWTLVPNQKGLERAIAAGCRRVSVFTAATDAFSERNVGLSVADSLAEIAQVVRTAKKLKLEVRGYVSTAFGCPFEGVVPARKTLQVVERLLKLGVFQVSIGDTIGVAHPKSVESVLRPALKHFGARKIALHFHDTRGTALANSLKALELGVRTLDASAGGLGGCPFAPGATGNLATEDLIYMLEGMGVETGVNLQQLCEVSLELSRRMNRPVSSRYLAAYQASCQQSKSAASSRQLPRQLQW